MLKTGSLFWRISSRKLVWSLDMPCPSSASSMAQDMLRWCTRLALPCPAALTKHDARVGKAG